MKKATLIAAILFAGSAGAQVYVKPHVTKDGAYVEGYQRTAPNSTKTDNYSTQGNVNPWTGQSGTVNPYTQPQNSYQQQPSYGQRQQQQCGTDGYGRYVCR